MALTNQQRMFMIRVTRNAEVLAAAITLAEETSDIYFDRSYDDLTNEDLAEMEVTATQLGAYITMAQQLVNFRDNEVVTQGDYGATLSQVRRLAG